MVSMLLWSVFSLTDWSDPECVHTFTHPLTHSVGEEEERTGWILLRDSELFVKDAERGVFPLP